MLSVMARAESGPSAQRTFNTASSASVTRIFFSFTVLPRSLHKQSANDHRHCAYESQEVVEQQVAKESKGRRELRAWRPARAIAGRALPIIRWEPEAGQGAGLVLSLAEHVAPIGTQAGMAIDPSRRPVNLDQIGAVAPPEPEMEPVIRGRLV